MKKSLIKIGTRNFDPIFQILRFFRTMFATSVICVTILAHYSLTNWQNFCKFSIISTNFLIPFLIINFKLETPVRKIATKNPTLTKIISFSSSYESINSTRPIQHVFVYTSKRANPFLVDFLFFVYRMRKLNNFQTQIQRKIRRLIRTNFLLPPISYSDARRKKKRKQFHRIVFLLIASLRISTKKMRRRQRTRRRNHNKYHHITRLTPFPETREVFESFFRNNIKS